MFGTLAICYLFLGGAGAGAIVACSLLDLAWVREPFGCATYVQGPHADPAERVVDFGFAAGLALLAAGAACLLVDLGRTDRVLSLFLHPQPTMLNVGAYALAALALLGGFAVAVRFLYLPRVPRGMVVAVEGAACAVGFTVMLYTGLLLQSVQGVAFWASPFVPALFVLSSASSGVAVVLAVVFFVEQADQPFPQRRIAPMRLALARADAAVIVAEAVCAAGLLLWAHASAHPGVAASLSTLTEGAMATAWWLGFCVCGLVAPLAAEIACAALARSAGRGANGAGERYARAFAFLAAAAALVLVGAFCLRWSVACAGTHRDLALEDAAPVQELILEDDLQTASKGYEKEDIW